jgi:hypothetical protein
VVLLLVQGRAGLPGWQVGVGEVPGGRHVWRGHSAHGHAGVCACDCGAASQCMCCRGYGLVPSALSPVLLPSVVLPSPTPSPKPEGGEGRAGEGDGGRGGGATAARIHHGAHTHTRGTVRLLPALSMQLLHIPAPQPPLDPQLSVCRVCHARPHGTKHSTQARTHSHARPREPLQHSGTHTSKRQCATGTRQPRSGGAGTQHTRHTASLRSKRQDNSDKPATAKGARSPIRNPSTSPPSTVRALPGKVRPVSGAAATAAVAPTGPGAAEGPPEAWDGAPTSEGAAEPSSTTPAAAAIVARAFRLALIMSSTMQRQWAKSTKRLEHWASCSWEGGDVGGRVDSGQQEEKRANEGTTARRMPRSAIVSNTRWVDQEGTRRCLHGHRVPGWE